MRKDTKNNCSGEILSDQVTNSESQGEPLRRIIFLLPDDDSLHTSLTPEG